MKVRVEHITEGEEEIVFRIYPKTAGTKRTGSGTKLTGDADGETLLFLPGDIFYFEAVDGRVFAYLEKSVVAVSASLEKLEEQLGESGFVRVSKSVVMNVNEVRAFQGMMGNRIIATMNNGEQIIVSRHYAKEVRAFLKGGK